MITPTWPRLAGWLALPEETTLRGRWRAREDGVETNGCFAFRPPDEWSVVDQSGSLVSEYDVSGLLAPWRWDGDDDRRSASAVRAIVHDGRPAWSVDLLPSDPEDGRLTLVVDVATRRCLRLGSASDDGFVEITELETGVDLPDEVFDLRRRQAEEERRMHELVQLLDVRPAPTPRWFPWRRTFHPAGGCLVVESDQGDGAVCRAPLGEEPPLPDSYIFAVDQEHLIRLDVGRWSWAVVTPSEIDEATARRIVDGVVEGRPYGDGLG